MVRPLPRHSINEITNCVCAPRLRVTAVKSNAIHELSRTFSRIHQLFHLETLNLTFHPIKDNQVNSNDTVLLALQVSILGALSASFKVRIPPNLTSFSLHNLRTSDISPLESPPFQNFLTTLRCLHLFVLFDLSTDQNFLNSHWCKFWSTFCPRMILAPTHYSLTELTLHSDVFLGTFSGLSFTGLHFPHLCALSLRNVFLQPSVGVEAFILRHATSLARLELLACKLPAYDIHPFPPFDLYPPPPPSQYCWNIIWDRFAVELTALVALNIEDPNCSYVSSCYMFIPFFDNTGQSRDATDFAALERFHAVVAARSEEMRGGILRKERQCLTS